MTQTQFDERLLCLERHMGNVLELLSEHRLPATKTEPPDPVNTCGGPALEGRTSGLVRDLAIVVASQNARLEEGVAVLENRLRELYGPCDAEPQPDRPPSGPGEICSLEDHLARLNELVSRILAGVGQV